MVLQLETQLGNPRHMKTADILVEEFSKAYRINLSELTLQEIKNILNDNDWIRLAFAIKYGEQLH
jgi:succinate dehydrogenase flavin-adding protein (antitoxin of CptAB toxin-antitoxin module)|tara:strand:- start:291 stop:485 length:195 start_codon:yes stop_codon:yes gene_type:complete